MADEKAATAVEDEGAVNLQDMTPEQREAFLRDEPELESKEKSEGETKASAESGAAPDAAKKKEQSDEEKPPETRGERRFRKLTAENKSLRERLDALENRGTERAAPTVAERTTAVSSKAPRLKTFDDQVGTKYATAAEAIEAWEDAVDVYHAEQRQKAVQEALRAERETMSKADQEKAAEKTTKKNAETFAKRAEDFRKTLKEDNFQAAFSEVYETVNEVLAERPEMAQIADILVESEVGPELVYYFGQNPDEFDALLEMPIARALREIGKLEVSDKIKAPPPKTRTAARRIGNQVAGANASSHDPELEAVEKNDMGAFLKADPNVARRRGAAW